MSAIKPDQKKQFVLVPVELIDKLREDRERMYDFVNTHNLSCEFVHMRLTDTMWKITHTRFPHLNQEYFTKLFNEFNRRYCNAVVSSDPFWYTEAAMAARAGVDILEKIGIIEDTWNQNYLNAQEKFKES